MVDYLVGTWGAYKSLQLDERTHHIHIYIYIYIYTETYTHKHTGSLSNDSLSHCVFLVLFFLTLCLFFFILTLSFFSFFSTISVSVSLWFS